MNSKPGVAAPCGLFCDNCHEDESNDLRVCCSETFCPSSLNPETCEIYKCCVGEAGLTDCGACAKFPCAKLLKFAHNGHHSERLPLILNLQRRRRLGYARWLAEEQAFWTRTQNACQWAHLERVLAAKWKCLEEAQACIREIANEVEQAMQGRRGVDMPAQRVSSRV